MYGLARLFTVTALVSTVYHWFQLLGEEKRHEQLF